MTQKEDGRVHLSVAPEKILDLETSTLLTARCRCGVVVAVDVPLDPSFAQLEAAEQRLDQLILQCAHPPEQT